MKHNPFGLLVILVAMIVPLIWMVPIAATKDPIALFSQYLGIAALIAMALGQIISTRVWPVEAVFGGLDRGYVLHKWLGITAMVAILLHDTIDAEMDGLGRETALVELAETLGELSLYGLLILVVISVSMFIPYHLWKWTHRLMGFFFMAGVFHYWFILKPFGNLDPLGAYTSAICALGVLAFLYRLLPGPMRPTKRYEVSAVEETGSAYAVTMTPKGRKMKYRAGQFAFVSFDGTEPHPFTISKAPSEDGSVRMTIAKLGDFTTRLRRDLVVGASARLEGPYGRFARPRSAEREIWVGAGIGITPFLAWAGAMDDNGAPVDLVYCVRTEAEAAHLHEIRAAAEAKDKLTLHVHCSKTDGRLDTDVLEHIVGGDIAGSHVSFCGPAIMRRALIQGLSRKGVPQRNVHFEEFEIRTGIGIRRLAAKLGGRAKMWLQTKAS